MTCLQGRWLIFAPAGDKDVVEQFILEIEPILGSVGSGSPVVAQSRPEIAEGKLVVILVQ